MSKAQEEFMSVKGQMQNIIAKFYAACQGIDIDDVGFAEDVNEAISDATNGAVKFEEFYE